MQGREHARKRSQLLGEKAQHRCLERPVTYRKHMVSPRDIECAA
jgi:hypothetical protein